MRKGNWTLIKVIAALAMLLSPGVLSGGHALAEDPPGTYTIQITDDGFTYGGKSGDIVVDVPQGQKITMKFVWAHVGYVTDEHIVTLEGYQLETKKLTGSAREDSIEFVAEKAGKFTFKCTNDCELHDYMQNAKISVSPGGGGGAAAVKRTPTTLTLQPGTQTSPSDPMLLMAVLKDDKGNPVPKSDITFSVDAEFVGVAKPMEVGQAKTDEQGTAFFYYEPKLFKPEQQITAHAAAVGLFADATQTTTVRPVGLTPYDVAPILLEPVRQWGMRGMVIVFVTLWSTFGYVVYTVLSIKRVRRAVP